MVCATVFAIHKRLYNLLSSLLGRHHLQRSNQINKKISKIITNGVLRSTYRKSAERRSSAQKKQV